MNPKKEKCERSRRTQWNIRLLGGNHHGWSWKKKIMIMISIEKDGDIDSHREKNRKSYESQCFCLPCLAKREYRTRNY
jgi:hypothetical protein